jgi:hypothetical protein
MERSPEQPHPEQEREADLYSELLAAESELRDIFTEIDLLITSRAEDTAVEALLPRYEDAQRRFSQTLGQWLEYVHSAAAE